MKKLILNGFDAVVRDMTAEEIAAIPQPETPKPVRVISALAFMERLTQQERIAIRHAAKANVELEDWLDLLRAAQVVDLDDPRTVEGLAAMVKAGLLTATRRDAILADARL
jgi:hypothetical protein